MLTGTSWHKTVAGAPALTSNIPGRQAGKGWRTNLRPTPPHVPLILSVSSSLRPTQRFADLREATPCFKGGKAPSVSCVGLARLCCCGRKEGDGRPTCSCSQCSRLCAEPSVPPGENCGEGRRGKSSAHPGSSGKPAPYEWQVVGLQQLVLASCPVQFPRRASHGFSAPGNAELHVLLLFGTQALLFALVFRAVTVGVPGYYSGPPK